MRKVHLLAAARLVLLIASSLFLRASSARGGDIPHLPYKEAGFTDREAAAFLIDRFTFGPRPGDVDAVVARGIDAWFYTQLAGNDPDTALERRLSPYTTLHLTNEEIASLYPNPGELLSLARNEGVLSDTAEETIVAAAGDGKPNQAYRREILRWARTKGFRPIRDYLGELLGQKVMRAVYTRNQLREVLTDFWFNHFNVSITKNQDRQFVLSYERDAIRPNVLGSFRTLLGATARHPAMLVYLDNTLSTAADSVPTTMSMKLDAYRNLPGLRGQIARERINAAEADRKNFENRQMKEIPAAFRPRKGINENYARELMELHTLGVDGGYTQEDVIEVARAFSGWTAYPLGVGYGREKAREHLANVMDRAANAGFVRDGDFLFRANAHDASAKTILGATFLAGGGEDEGERVLDMLAENPATERHIARQLAARFVSDTPPEKLVERLAATFRQTHGDLREMMIEIAVSPEFWSAAARRSKIKSPFELAVSALRGINADIYDPRGTVQWIGRMGEPLYAYQAPTGYPDRSEAWVNAGALLNRMSFGMSLGTEEIPGVEYDPAALSSGPEPESTEATVRAYARVLLPGRDVSATVSAVLPAVLTPDLAQRVRARQPEARRSEDDMMSMDAAPPDTVRASAAPRDAHEQVLAQVVGVIIGSPEFQRR